MERVNEKFKKGIICSSVVIIAFMLYCISEMIVSWCVRYTYYYATGRIVSAVCLFVLAIVYATQYKKIGIFPMLVCSVIFFAIAVDFFKFGANAFFGASTDVNTLRIYPLIMQFEKYRDLSHPQNSWATDDNLDLIRFSTCTVTFVIAMLVGIIIMSVALLVKKSKQDDVKANKILCRTMLGLTVFLFVEFMRGVFLNLSL
ncbi:MAG: hypothetical protein K2L70_01710 [Clostridia bacterium]|nr:hypothetical protein [Clostridia bacterium]